MSLREALTCRSCGGSGTVERLVPVGSGIDGTRVELEGQPADLIPEPCPECLDGIPRDLIETGAEAIGPAGEWWGPNGAARYVKDVLLALRDKEEPRED